MGAALLSEVERVAQAEGVRELALDTSEHATHLIAYYTKKGYRFVEHVRWSTEPFVNILNAVPRLHERTVICTNSREVDTQHGPFTLKTYKDTARNECHFALVKGTIDPAVETLVRVHVGSTLRDVLGIAQPGAAGPAWTCQSALARVAQEGAGVVVLICHNETTDDIEESIDWLLTGKVRRPNVELAYKQVGTGSQILKDLGVCKMRLLSAPYKFNGISGFNLEVTGYIEHPGG